MTTLPLHFRDGHLFLGAGGALWLLDTGAPASFGAEPTVTIAGERFEVAGGHRGLTASSLSSFVGVECAGLLGADVLSRFDFLLDVPGGEAEVSTGRLEHGGTTVPLDEVMGIPIVSARIRGVPHRMFFDTGAQLSYLQDDSRTTFPPAGRVTDFYPGVGHFETETHDVDVDLGGVALTLRCGVLPGSLGPALMMAGTHGIIGNQVLANRKASYFPRRRALVL